jgi:succinate dehydrogenase / fumarate reductase membrane anchor subunit
MADSGKTLRVDVLRSELGRVRGLGPARAGSGHWWVVRLTSLALVPLSLWFIAAVIRHEGATRAEMVKWLRGPVPFVLLLCLIIATFWHMELGLRVVIEDYVHRNDARLALLLASRAACILAGLLCIFAVLRLGL